MLAALGGTTSAAAPPRPNFLFLYADDLGYGDLHCYGHPRAVTPRLDRLAAEGTRYTQFYVSHCVCSPTRTSAITGQYPSRHRIFAHIAQLEANTTRNMPRRGTELSARDAEGRLPHSPFRQVASRRG
jgi:arylsulfatase A-like enzyme